MALYTCKLVFDQAVARFDQWSNTISPGRIWVFGTLMVLWVLYVFRSFSTAAKIAEIDRDLSRLSTLGGQLKYFVAPHESEYHMFVSKALLAEHDIRHDVRIALMAVAGVLLFASFGVATRQQVVAIEPTGIFAKDKKELPDD